VDDVDRETARDHHDDHDADYRPNLLEVRAFDYLLVVPLGTFREEHGLTASKSKGQLLKVCANWGFLHE
jgi:hypothetical protein